MNGSVSPPQAFDETTEHTSPERRLMMAIVITAVNDALGKSACNDSPQERAVARERAMDWFERNGRDFRLTCLSAGLEPDAVRTGALAYIGANCGKARKEPRGGKPVRYGVPMRVIAERASVGVPTVRDVLEGRGNPRAANRERVIAAYRELTAERGLPDMFETRVQDEAA